MVAGVVAAHCLSVAAVSAHWYGWLPCPGLGPLVCGGSLPMAAWRGLDLLALSALRWGGQYSRQWSSQGSHALGGLWMSVTLISSISVLGTRGQVCGSSHPLLHIFMEKPYMHKHTHTYTHRCLN
ncbi:hypothetical protein AMECASPLE_038729 [Ameca splendens]|uniref:Secreted protein n=1 Tax=Ameca splendens TaxID=208324 RepID=A0ABV0XLC3_9TELE